MSVTRYQSKIRYYREVIQATNTTHNKVRFKNLAGQSILTPDAVVTASSNPTSGSLDRILSPTGETCVFGADKLVTITIDLNQVYDVNAIEVRHATSGTFDKVLVQASTDGISWFTLYDSTLDGTYSETSAGVLFNSSYEITVNDRSQIITDVEDNAPFDPKQMIWENDEKLMEYFESLVERAQHYILNQTSTNKALILESLTGLYPVNYFESMMVYWVHRATADSVNDATIKVGNLVAKPLIQQGQETITLTEGEPYIAIYDISIGKFKLLSGGGSGLAGKINTVQPTNNFLKYDLGAFDKATGTFVSPDLNLENPILAEAILFPKSYGFEGCINGMVEIPGMLDVDGNAIESGEVYFVSQTNNKKVTKVQPEGGLVQPFMQTYMSRGKLYAMLMQTDSFYGDSGTVWTSGRGFRTNGNVLELDAVDGEVRSDVPRFEVAVTEKDLVGYTGRSVDTIEDLKKVKRAKVGDVVEVLGYYVKGDGANHKRKKMATGYAGTDAVIGTDGSIWGIVHNGEVNVSWFGAKSDNITNNTQFIQNAINLKNTNVIVIDNDYYISETIIFSCSKTLEFKGKLIIDNEFRATNDCVIFSSMWGQDAKLGAPHFIRPHIETKRYSTFNTSTEVATYKDFVDVCGIILHATAMASIHQPTILGLKKDGIIIAGGYGARLDNSLIRTIPATLDILGDINFTNIGDTGGEYFQNKRYPAGISVYGTDCFIDNCQTVNYPVGIYTKNANEFVNCHPWAIPQTTKTKMLYGFVVTGTGNRLMGCYADTVSNINNLYEGLNGGVGFYETKSTDHTVKETISDRNIFINSKVLGTNFSSEGTFSFSLGDSASNSAGLGDCLVATIGVNVRANHIKLYNNKIQSLFSYNSLGEFDNVFRYLTVNTLNFSNEDSIRISGTGYLKLKSKNLQINDQSVTREVSIDGVNKYPIFLPTTTISKLSDIASLGRYGTLSFLYTGQEIEAGSCGLKFEGTKNQSLVNTPSGKLLFINGDQISTIQTSANFQSLDTPFHASNMSRLGILDKYHNYLAELHEYEKSQNTQSDYKVMNLSILLPPVIPTEVEEYAKEYNAI